MKKKMLFLIIGIISFITIPNNVKASFVDPYLDEDGYIYIDSIVPSDDEEVLGIIQDYFFKNYNISVSPNSCNSNYTVCNLELYPSYATANNVKFKYNLDANEKKDEVLSIYSELQTKRTYEVSSMDMINYYLFNNYSPLSTDENFSMAYKIGYSIASSYSLRNLSNNFSTSINVIPRKGAGEPFYTMVGGNGILRINNTIYSGNLPTTVELYRVIYIPEGSEDYLQTARGLISSNFDGNVDGKISLKYGGPVTSFNHQINYYPFISFTNGLSEEDINYTLNKTGGTYDHNYYVLTINNIDYYVLIIENNDKMRDPIKPKFKDPITNIEIESRKYGIPYATETNIDDVTDNNEDLSNVFNSSNYRLYDINLLPLKTNYDYSNNYYNFSFPIPSNYESVDVYYYNNGTYEKCDRTISNSYINVENKKLGRFAVVENLEEIWPESISFESDSVDLNIDDYYALNVIFNPNNVTRNEVTYSSSDEEIAEIDNNYVHVKKYGTVTITATTSNGKKAYLTVNAEEPFYAVEDINFNVNSNTLTLKEGETFILNATVTPAYATDNTINWDVSDSTVIDLNNGLLTALKTGTSTITITSSNNLSKTLTVIVNEKDNYLDDYLNSNGEYEINLSTYKPNDNDTLLVLLRECITKPNNSKIVSNITSIAEDFNTITVNYNGTPVNVNLVYRNQDSNYYSFMNKINQIPNRSAYELNDMDIINFYLSFADNESMSGEQKFQYGIKYSSKFNSDLDNYSIYSRVIPRKGDAGLFNYYIGGNLTFTDYNNIVIYSASKYVDYRLENVIYVPDGTTNYLSYVQNKINNYYGSDNISISLGGNISDLLNEKSNFIGNYSSSFQSVEQLINYYNEELIKYGGKSDNKYYKVTINNKEYIFIIVENSNKAINNNSITYKSMYSDLIIESHNTNTSNEFGNISQCFEQGDESINFFYGDVSSLFASDNYSLYKTELYTYTSNISETDNYIIKIPISSRFKNKQIKVNKLVWQTGKLVKEKINYSIENGYIIINGNPFNTTFSIEEKIEKRLIGYTTHVQNIGWQDYVYDGTMAGTSGRAFRLEGIKIKLLNQDYEGNLEYRTHVQNIGWQDYVSNGEMSGTSGRAYRLEAIQIRLTGEMANHYDVYYRVHAQNLGWMNWAKNDEMSGTAGYAYRLEGIEIVLVEKGDSPPERTNTNSKYSFKDKNADPQDALIKYTTHVQNIGWQSYVYDGAMAGTSGRALRLEGIKIQMINNPYSGNIKYRTHVQNIGWQDYVSNGEMSGTSGRAYRLEAIQIRLTGEMAEHYDVYYRVHAQNFGWLGWAKNDEMAGTAGCAYRLEGIEIRLINKNDSFNEQKSNHFIEKKDGFYVIDNHSIQFYNENYVIDKEKKLINKIIGRYLYLDGYDAYFKIDKERYNEEKVLDAWSYRMVYYKGRIVAEGDDDYESCLHDTESHPQNLHNLLLESYGGTKLITEYDASINNNKLYLNINNKTYIFTINSTQKPVILSLDNNNITINRGETKKITLKVKYYHTNHEINKILSNPSIASCSGFSTSSNGQIEISCRGTKAGNTKIRFEDTKGGNYVELNINVNYAIIHPTDISIRDDVNKIVTSLDMVKGDRINLKASLYPYDSDNKEVIWSSSNKEIASVIDTGLVTAKSKGTVIIAAKSKDDSSVKASCIVNVSNTPLKTIANIKEYSKIESGSKVSNVHLSIDISGGTERYSCDYARIYKDGLIVTEDGCENFQNTINNNYTLNVYPADSGVYYADYQFHDSDGDVSSGTTNTITVTD